VSTREGMDYLSHSLGIQGDEVAGRNLLLGFGHWVGIMSGGRTNEKKGRSFAEGKGVRSKKKGCLNH
jgi:hypothetical protein